MTSIKSENLDSYYQWKLPFNEITNECIINDKYLKNPIIYISDLGNIEYIDKKGENEIQTWYYRAPEIIIDYPYNEKIDVWSLGCMVYEMATGVLLFNPKHEPLNEDAHHLFLIQTLLEPFPKYMIDRSDRELYLFKSYKIRNVSRSDPHPLKDILKTRFDNDFIDFLYKCLVIDPNKRSSCEDLLKHKWLNS